MAMGFTPLILLDLPSLFADAVTDNAVNLHDRHVQDVLSSLSEKDLNRTIHFASDVISYMKTLENNLLWSNVKVFDGTPSHGMLISFGPEKEASDRGKHGLIAIKSTIQLMGILCHKIGHLSNQDCAKLMARFTFYSTALEESCPMYGQRCSKEQIESAYRTMNGSCNNLENGQRGVAFTGYARLLYADYSDGVHAMRRSVTKKLLPNARFVVSSLIKSDSKPSKKFTLALMQWSQFLEHDLARSATSTAIHTGSPIECCSNEGDALLPRHVHPFCSPIDVSHDKNYTDNGISCLSFVRSLPAVRNDCTFGASDQMNQATHYLDGSQIYGSTLRKSNKLRAFKHGKLRTSAYQGRQFLPLSDDATRHCQQFSKNSTCFKSGDARVNFLPQLALMHTLWFREHNRIADELGNLNPHWNDEVLFQETRRIVIAEMQKITYGEWLPIVLGKSAQEVIMSTSFNRSVDASVSNAFATAAIRSLVSLSDDKPKLFDENRLTDAPIILMRNYFHNPGVLRQEGALDDLIRGLTTQSSQALDNYYADDLINNLYSNGKFGFDVLSFDLQRGRDHGLPPYLEYRKLCGLGTAEGFVEFLNFMNGEHVMALKHVYAHPRDVDLIIGGLLEKSEREGLLGPTFSCILSDQMLRTRQGDRYFYDNQNQPKPFTSEQLKQIEKVSLARIICDNSDDVQTMQKMVFKRVTSSNPLLKCSSTLIPKMDLNYWQDAEI